MFKFDSSFVTDVGKVRKNNEDNFYLNGVYKRVPEDLTYEKTELLYGDGVFAVCDGMGGEEYGEKASLLAVETLKEFQNKDIDDVVDHYIETVNTKICDFINENNGTRSGTTLALLHIKNGLAISYNIGDSRVYLYRKGRLFQLSEDHTQTNQMIKMGILTKEKASLHKDRHVLTQHLGIFPDELIIQAYKSDIISIKNNDIFLLCSDGLTDMLSDVEIESLLKNNALNKNCYKILKDAALAKGGKDNITIGIVKVIGKKQGILSDLWGKN